MSDIDCRPFVEMDQSKFSVLMDTLCSIENVLASTKRDNLSDMSREMAVKAPATRKGLATRDRIVEAAARLMQEQGVAGTSLDEVEAAASVGRSQLYHYFAGKDDLVGAVIEYQARSIITSPTVASGLSTWEAWQEWERETVLHSSEDDCAGGCPLGSLASELADISEDARQRLAASFLLWESSFREGLSSMKDEGLLDASADPDRLATVIMTSLEGGLLMSQTHRDKKYLEIALGGALDQVRAAGGFTRQIG